MNLSSGRSRWRTDKAVYVYALLGIRIESSVATRFEDKTDATLRPFNVSELFKSTRRFQMLVNKMAIGKVVGVVALALLSGTPAYADSYSFTTVLDSQRDGLEARRCPAINTLGTVAVTVLDNADGLTKIVTKRGATDAPVVVATTAQQADFPTFCDNGITSTSSDPSINEKGEVAFQTNLRRLTTREECATTAQRTRRRGVFLGNGGPLTTILHTVNGPGAEFDEILVADQSVNTVGKVAMVLEKDNFDQGLFVGSKSGTLNQRFLADTTTPDGFNFNNISSRVSLNELGQVAFESGLNDTFVSGIFLSNPNGTFRTIVDNTGALSSVSDPSLNVFGRVAFQADRFDALDRQIFSINTSRGGPVTTVAESNPDPLAEGPVYSSFREPSLNDLGGVAFTADILVDPTVFVTTQGVFTGANPVTDKVLQVGDLYEGVPVTSVVTCSEALNNRGQIVMTVQSEDPETFELRTFIVKATPSQMHDDD